MFRRYSIYSLFGLFCIGLITTPVQAFLGRATWYQYRAEMMYLLLHGLQPLKTTALQAGDRDAAKDASETADNGGKVEEQAPKICIYGERANQYIENYFDDSANLWGMQVITALWRPGDAIDTCTILYLDGERSVEAGRAIADTAGVLIVGNEEDFVKQGGMVGIDRRGGKFHWTVNIETLAASGVTLHSGMLELMHYYNAGDRILP